VSVTKKIGEEAMLVLTRKRDEMITIGSDIVIRVIKTGKGSVKIGIEAPASVRVRRGELAVTEVETTASDLITVEHADEDEDELMDEVELFEICTLGAVLVQN
jgi:carbon storage regulator